MTVEKARKAAETQLGFEIPDDVAKEVMVFSKRKCELNGKGESYLPLLYEDELKQYYFRMAINLMGGMNNVRDLSPVPV